MKNEEIEKIKNCFNPIKVKDKLPDTDRRVSVRLNSGYIQHIYYRYLEEEKKWQWQRDNEQWVDGGESKRHKILEWSEIA